MPTLSALRSASSLVLSAALASRLRPHGRIARCRRLLDMLSSSTCALLPERPLPHSFSTIAASVSSSSSSPALSRPLPAKRQAQSAATEQEFQPVLSAGRLDACGLDDDHRSDVPDPSGMIQSAAAQQALQQPSQLMIDAPLHPPPAALCLPISTLHTSQSTETEQLFVLHCSIIESDSYAMALLTAQPLPPSALQLAGLTPHAGLQLSAAQLEEAKSWMQRTMSVVVRRAAADRQQESEPLRDYLLVPVLRDEATAAVSVDWEMMSHSLWSDAPRLVQALAQCSAAGQTEPRSATPRLPLPTPLLQLLKSLPLVLYRLESQLHALSFLQSAGLPDSFLPLTLTALTSRNADHSSHYERLEFPGDAFIKLALSAALFSHRPAAGVEELAEARSQNSCNARLSELGLRHGLLSCIRARPFSLLKMSVAGLTDAESEPLSRDVVADAVEAAIAACYLQGGEEAALTLMERLGLPCRVAPPASQDFDLDEFCSSLPTAQSQLVRDFPSSSLPAIESRLEYRFRSPSLLLSAFCHPSCELPLDHRRLAFVGEAAADFLISERLFQQPAAPQPGEMTEMRQRLVGLDAYGRLLQRLSLHSYIICTGEQLNVLQRWRREEAELEAGRQTRWVPRLFSDIMKSLLGAVLVDSGMRTDSLRRLWQRLALDDR